MISPRYARVFTGIAVMALVPTFIHSYVGLRLEDGRSTKRIASALGAFSSEPTDKTAKWVENRFKSSDWIERYYREGDAAPLLLFAARSYDAKRLYHHPELALIQGGDFDPPKIIRPTGDPARTIHVLRGKGDASAQWVFYALLSEARFVDDPIRFQLRTAWRSVFRPRPPMTLFFVSDARPAPDVSIERSRALRLLNLAIDSFLSQRTVEGDEP